MGYNQPAVEFSTLEWVDWFNTRRLLEPIGTISPTEAEARFCAQATVQTLPPDPSQMTFKNPGEIQLVSSPKHHPGHQPTIMLEIG